jgi:hypothetical protein
MNKKKSKIVRHQTAAEAIYFKTKTQVVSRSKVLGKISKINFMRAVYCLERKYPILGVSDELNNFILRENHCPSFITWSYASETQEVYTKLLNYDIDPALSLYHIEVVEDIDTFDIYMVTSHAIADAVSLMHLHQELVLFCDTVMQNISVNIEVQNIAAGIDAAVDLSSKGPIMPNRAEYSGDFAKLKCLKVDDYQFCLKRMLLGSDKLQDIIATGKAHGVSLHSILVAAFALGLQELSPVKSCQILMRSSIDLRRRVRPTLSNNIICTAVTGHVTWIKNLNTNIIEIARFVSAEIKTSTANGSMFADYKEYASQFVNISKLKPIALNISDMGVMHLCEHHHLRHLAFEYGAGLKTDYPNVSITINSSGLVANIVYIKHAIADDIVDKLSDLTLQILNF